MNSQSREVKSNYASQSGMARRGTVPASSGDFSSFNWHVKGPGWRTEPRNAEQIHHSVTDAAISSRILLLCTNQSSLQSPFSPSPSAHSTCQRSDHESPCSSSCEHCDYLSAFAVFEWRQLVLVAAFSIFCESLSPSITIQHDPVTLHLFTTSSRQISM